MKSKGLIILAVVVGVVILLVMALPFLVNADAFRPTVQAQLRSSLGRQVEIGKLKLSLLAGGIEADEITIADDEHFSKSPFLHAKSLEVGVELMPLIFSRSLRVTGVTLKEPAVVLLHSTSGKWNFSSIGAGGQGGKSPGEFSIGKLTIEKGRVTVGQVSSRGKKFVYEDVNLVARNISYGSTIPFTFEAKTPGGGKLKLEGTAGPIDRADTALSPLNVKISVEHMDMASTGFLDPASGIGGVLDYTGTLQSDGKAARSEGSAKVDKVRLVRSGAPAKQPVSFDCASDYDLKRQSGVLNKGDIRTGNSTAKLSGNYDMRGESTTVHMKLSGTRLPIQDVQGLLPALGVILPPGSSLQGGTVDANLSLDGPVDRLVTSGTVNVSNSKLAGFNLASKLSALSALAGLKPSSETVIQTLSSNLRIAPEGIRADNLNLLVPDIGSMTGNGIIGANNALNFRMVAKLAGGGGLLAPMSAIGTLGQSKGGIPFLIQGTTSNPIFVPDVAGAMTQTVTAPAQGIGEVFGGLFGGKKKKQ